MRRRERKQVRDQCSIELHFFPVVEVVLLKQQSHWNTEKNRRGPTRTGQDTHSRQVKKKKEGQHRGSGEAAGALAPLRCSLPWLD